MNHPVTTTPPNFVQNLNMRLVNLASRISPHYHRKNSRNCRLRYWRCKPTSKRHLIAFTQHWISAMAIEQSAMRLETGKDFGVCHFTDGPLQVTVDLPKRVSWDQSQLSAIATRIANSGEKVSDFIDIEFSISESRYNNWPTSLKEQFTDARTVKPGKASYRLALINTKGESA